MSFGGNRDGGLLGKSRKDSPHTSEKRVGKLARDKKVEKFLSLCANRPCEVVPECVVANDLGTMHASKTTR